MDAEFHLAQVVKARPRICISSLPGHAKRARVKTSPDQAPLGRDRAPGPGRNAANSDADVADGFAVQAECHGSGC